MGLCCLPAAGSDATLVLLRKDGFLGTFSLSIETLIAASAQMDFDSTPRSAVAVARPQNFKKADTPTPGLSDKAKKKTAETSNVKGERKSYCVLVAASG